MSEASNERLLKILKDIDRQEPYNDLLKAIKATHDNYKSIESLVEEIREDGSNTIARLIKGPVDYDEIVRDVERSIIIDTCFFSHRCTADRC